MTHATNKHGEPFDHFFCEVCQNQLMGTQVQIADDSRLPVCDLCWNQMSVGQRVKIAADLRHHQKIAEAIDTAGAWLEVARRLVEIAEDGERQEAGRGEEWLN